MPTVVNGIGTWYYGKRHVFRRKDVCEFCNRVGELQSYDTTLYFVVFFIPLLPLGSKRILSSCPYCQQHRLLPLGEWERMKAADSARVLDRLQTNPEDREATLEALGLAAGYQDGALFDKVAEGLAADRTGDAAIQRQLGAGYSFFGRYPEAEAAYRASLNVQPDDEVRRLLALALLRQGRPAEAEPLARHVLDDKLADHQWLLYLTIEAFQAQGMHQEALQLMDRRDAAFPATAADGDAVQQRRTSEKNLDSGKKVTSSYLAQSRQPAYSEGGRGRLAKLVGPLVALVLLALYVGIAIYKGQNRKVYLVNGVGVAYTVAVNGREVAMPANMQVAMPMAEGTITLEFRGHLAKRPPASYLVESPFWTRPFSSPTFVLNPDQCAILTTEEATYSANPRPPRTVGTHLGKPQYQFSDMDYEFDPFPLQMQVKRGSTATRQRVGLVAVPSQEIRLSLMTSELPPEAQVAYARSLLEFDPDALFFLHFLAVTGRDEATLDYFRVHLGDRPLRVEWHRTYQALMGQVHPEQDLVPDYRKLIADEKDHPDALYLLARLVDYDEADRLLQKATEGPTKSAYATYARGFDDLTAGRFRDAVTRIGASREAQAGNPLMRHWHRQALLAAGQFEPLLNEMAAESQGPGGGIQARVEQSRLLAARGDRAQAQAVETDTIAMLNSANTYGVLREQVLGALRMARACGSQDVKAYLELTANDASSNWIRALLQGQLDTLATAKVADTELTEKIGLTFLAATASGKKDMADQALRDLMTRLRGQGDRHERHLADILDGKRAMKPGELRRMPLAPEEKRVLLAVAARRFPEAAAELLPLAKALNYHRDAVALCLAKYLD